jgi:CBS domain containing-hemolysin-like protein
MTVFLLFLAAAVSLMFSAFFSGTETGFLSVSRERILHLAREGGRKAKIVQSAMEDMGRTTTTLLIGNNIANVSYSSSTAAIAAELFSSKDSVPHIVWSLFAAFLVLYLSEFMPKLLCSARPLRRSLLLAGPYSIVSLALSPFTAIAMKLTDIFMPEKDSKYNLTASDLMRILEDRKDGVCLSDIESALITRILVLRVKGRRITPEELLSALKDAD